MLKSILTVSPLRISFVGGGTDIPNYYLKNSGKVVSTAINKYVYVFIKRHDTAFGEKFRLSYSEVEHVNSIDEIKNNIIRECLKFLEIDEPLHISTLADLPAGSGLGSSSSFTTALLLGLHKLKGEVVTKYQLAEEACHIEINKLQQPIGKQDQYAVSFGGFNCFEFLPNNTVKIDPVLLSAKLENEFIKRSVLFWTNQTRGATRILEDQQQRSATNEIKLAKMYDLATEFRNNLQEIIDWTKLRNLISEGWELKKTFSPLIEKFDKNHLLLEVEKYYKTGFKILGAGGGGFVYVLKPDLDSQLPFFSGDNINVVKPMIDHNGSRVIAEF